MFFDLPYGAKVDKYLAGMPTTSWLTWTNPRNEYNNAIILAAGGGGGGGGGNGGGAGGGGGGAGAFCSIYCPLSLLPDILHIQTGLGGAGRVFEGGGLSGAATYISIYPNTNAANLLVTCGAGGGAGASGGAGSGGTVTIGNTVGVVQGYNGNNGSTAGSPASDAILSTGSPIFGGTGGGGYSYPTGGASGGFQTYSNVIPYSPGTPSNGGSGKRGYVIWKPFTVFGGSGGSQGPGGNGFMGSGGGGEGVSGGSSSSGSGGAGFVIIICY